MKTLLCILLAMLVAVTSNSAWGQSSGEANGGAATAGAAVKAEGKTPPVYERAFESMGALHPATVHMPIALLTVAAMFIVIRRIFPMVSADVAFYCLLVGAAGAVGAAVLGFGFASLEGYKWDSETIDGHRWGGVAVAVVASLMAMLAIAERRTGNRKIGTIWQVGTLGVAALVGLVGHQGGELVHEDLYAKAWDHTFNFQPPTTIVYDAPPPSETPVKIETVANGATGTATGAATPGPALVRVDFVKQVLPVLQEKCFSCHGPEKKKGGLRLDTEALALEGGDTGPAYIAGNAKESLMLKLIASEDDDEKMPPPGKGKVVTREEYEALKNWVLQGAIWTGPGAKVAAKG